MDLDEAGTPCVKTCFCVCLLAVNAILCTKSLLVADACPNKAITSPRVRAAARHCMLLTGSSGCQGADRSRASKPKECRPYRYMVGVLLIRQEQFSEMTGRNLYTIWRPMAPRDTTRGERMRIPAMEYC